MAAHAKFSPSKMQRIIACPGSVALESGFEDTRNDYADEGTVAHELAAECLKKGLNADHRLGQFAVVDDKGDVTWEGAK